ncbi:MAG: amino acid ABC transporter substrate-binding protein [Candidatus Eisenbacteria bacterium]|uniref:Amino acid ABC transporter substrate-binding protein n=1 Tax=Eiseniibacteriota bacterium TaxID=2212470 RepID=A0A933SHK1_UNCEI|nr:amino acid ABC transporter substrate-binding protein [Candidatus Eisenbacteria bacterium]
MRTLVRWLPILAIAATTAAAAFAASPPLTRVSADALAASPQSSDRDARLGDWARRAPLDDVLWVLRRPASQLGKAERTLVQAAIDHTPAARAELRRRLELRRQLADAAGRRSGREVGDLETQRPRASVWRVGAVLPDAGDYAGYGDALRVALEAGLAYGRDGAPSFDVDVIGSGDNEPARAIAAFDTLSRRCAVVVGELLSPPTFALAAASRYTGVPVVSPTATDESIGRSGPLVFAIGPSSEERGAVLARAVLEGKPRKVAIYTSQSSAADPFVRSFAATAESLGAKIVRRETYAGGTTDFRVLSRGLRTFGAEVLFWDGESREADALLRQISADGVGVKVCGGSELSPDRMHTMTRPLLDGVRWVADDWKLPAVQQAVLDSIAKSRSERAGTIWVRGFLAGRRIAAAVDAGARTPAELGARLRHRDGARRAAGFLECTLDGATLPVYLVQRGKNTEPTP